MNGHVTIAAIYSVGLSYLPAIEEQFQAKFPSANHSVQLAHPHDVYRMVEQGTVDFGLISYPEASKTIQATHWRDESMVLVASPRHRLANSQPVSLAALNQCGLVAFAPNLRIRQEIDRHTAEYGYHDARRDRTGQHRFDEACRFGEQRCCICPEADGSSRTGVGSAPGDRLSWTSFSRSLGIIQRRHVAMSRSARAFLELLLQDAGVELRRAICHRQVWTSRNLRKLRLPNKHRWRSSGTRCR